MAETMGGDPYLESAAQETLSGLYALREEGLMHQASVSGVNINQAKAEHDKTTSHNEEELFKLMPMDENKKRIMQEVALEGAKAFWVKKLKEPGLPTNAAILGRERVTEITQSLEELNKPPQVPK